MNKSRLIKRLIPFFLLIALFCCLFLLLKQLTKPEKIIFHFAPVESIQNRIRMQVKPVRLEQEMFLVFHLEIETFQDPEILEFNPKEISHLELVKDEIGEVTILNPIQWKETHKDEYRKDGELYFKLNQPLAKKITLVIYELEKREFVWNFSKTLKK